MDQDLRIQVSSMNSVQWAPHDSGICMILAWCAAPVKAPFPPPTPS